MIVLWIFGSKRATKNFTTGSSSGMLHGRSPKQDHTDMRSNSNRVNVIGKSLSDLFALLWVYGSNGFVQCWHYVILVESKRE
jgi:hypothetical protein